MNERQPKPVIEALDLRVLAYFARKHLALGLPDEVIDQVLEQALQGNGPAEYIVGSWWEALSYDTQARYWYLSSAAHNHAPALAKLRAHPTSEAAAMPEKKRMAG